MCQITKIGPHNVHNVTIVRRNGEIGHYKGLVSNHSNIAQNCWISYKHQLENIYEMTCSLVN